MLSLYLFPLSAHLLPGGRMSLRIFEPRYIRMVKECCAQQKSFALCMLNPKGSKDTNQHIYPMATRANIVDFSRLDDGLLGITVEGVELVDIKGIETQDDGLRVGHCELVEMVLVDTPDEQEREAAIKLNHILNEYPELSQMYPYVHSDDINWVLYRWLELLPIAADEKQAILQDKDLSKFSSFLANFIK